MDNSNMWNSEEKRLERKERLNSLKQKGGVKKPIRKSGKFVRIFLPILAAVAVLIAGLWAAVQFAVPQKLFPPMSIGGTSISSAEFSYYYYNALSGLSIDKTTDEGKTKLNTLCTVEGYTDVTWRDYAYDLTAKQVVEVQIQYQLAKAAGMKLSDSDVKSLDDVFDNLVTQMGSKVKADKYLMDLFGRDVTMSSLRPVFEKATLANNYKTETVDAMDISDEDIEAKYTANKDDYDKISFRLTYFSIDTATDATDAEKETADAAAKKLAEDFLTKVTDGASFKSENAAKTLLEEKAKYDAMTAAEKKTEDASKAEEAKAKADLIATMTAEEKAAYDLAEANTDPTMVYSMTKADLSNASADLTKWLYDAARKEGDKSVFKIGSGYYAIYFVSRDTEFHLPSVRHILISPNKDKDTSSGDAFTAAEWTAARKTAGEVLAKCTTEEKFIALVPEYSTDTGSSSSEGLYEDITRGQMVQTFTDWSFDASRKPGDTGIVRSEYGFHVMWFVGFKDSTSLSANHDTIKSAIAEEQYTKLLDEKKALDEYKYKINSFGVKLTDFGN